MRRILQQREILEDEWRYLEEIDSSSVSEPALIVPLAALAEDERWRRFPGRLGVRVGAAARIEEVAPHLPRLELVAFEFPGTGDGRGYSFARALRSRYAFAGQVRARGAVRRDQVFFMMRAGFDAFEAAAGEDLEALRLALGRYSVAYQPGAPGAPVPARRFGPF